MYGKLKKCFHTDPILKIGDRKKYRKSKAGDKFCNLCMEEKLVITSNNNPNELLNQRSEILNDCRHSKIWLLGRLSMIQFLNANFILFGVLLINKM